MTTTVLADFILCLLALIVATLVAEWLWHNERLRRWARWRWERPSVGHPQFRRELALWKETRPR